MKIKHDILNMSHQQMADPDYLHDSWNAAVTVNLDHVQKCKRGIAQDLLHHRATEAFFAHREDPSSGIIHLPSAIKSNCTLSFLLMENNVCGVALGTAGKGIDGGKKNANLIFVSSRLICTTQT